MELINSLIVFFLCKLSFCNIDLLFSFYFYKGVIYFDEGDNEAVISLTIVQDNTRESAEKFQLTLLPNSVTGNAKVEGVTTAELLIEDSDNMYGTVEFGPGTEHELLTVSDLF